MFGRYEEYTDLQTGSSVWRTVYYIKLPNNQLVPILGLKGLNTTALVANLNITGKTFASQCFFACLLIRENKLEVL